MGRRRRPRHLSRPRSPAPPGIPKGPLPGASPTYAWCGRPTGRGTSPPELPDPPRRWRRTGARPAAPPPRPPPCPRVSPAPAPPSSGPRVRERWVLEFEPTGRREPDRLIGWVGGADPLEQVRLEFPSREAALAYAERYGLACEVSEPHRRSVTPKPYVENFLAVPTPELWPELLLAA